MREKDSVLPIPLVPSEERNSDTVVQLIQSQLKDQGPGWLYGSTSTNTGSSRSRQRSHPPSLPPSSEPELPPREIVFNLQRSREQRAGGASPALSHTSAPTRDEGSLVRQKEIRGQ